MGTPQLIWCMTSHLFEVRVCLKITYFWKEPGHSRIVPKTYIVFICPSFLTRKMNKMRQEYFRWEEDLILGNHWPTWGPFKGNRNKTFVRWFYFSLGRFRFYRPWSLRVVVTVSDPWSPCRGVSYKFTYPYWLENRTVFTEGRHGETSLRTKRT